MTRHATILFLLAVSLLGGCSSLKDVGREPDLSAVGSGIVEQAAPQAMSLSAGRSLPAPGSLWDNRTGDLFRDQRAMRAGDLLTINISIDDRANLGNSTDRSKNAKVKSNFDFLLGAFGLARNGNGALNIESNSSANGQGTIARSEKVQLSIAAVVVNVLPNGNLMISGSQEIRVDYEMRQLTIAGIVRPRDISKDNMIPYDKVAEARVSYGGAGRLSEVQQPGVVHQVYDIIRPF